MYISKLLIFTYSALPRAFLQLSSDVMVLNRMQKILPSNQPHLTTSHHTKTARLHGTMNPARCLHKLTRRPLQRCLFSSAPPEEGLEWPLLVRRAREAVEDDTRQHTRRPRTLSPAEKARSKLEKAQETLDGILKGSIARPGKPKWKPRVEPMAPLAAPSSSKQQHPRLLVSGLSANVRLADFYRVQGNGLSDWNANPTEGKPIYSPLNNRPG